MALTVNTNIASLTAQRNLTGSQNDLSTSLQRLSSGLRINSARDDAAGLAISERFTAQIRGLNQGIRNANDGISVAQTAEGAMSEITNNLQRIRELAVQSANASNTADDRAALQVEVSALLNEIQRVATNTNFNGNQLLNGTFNGATFQVGANKGETVDFGNIADMQTAALGSTTTNTSAGLSANSSTITVLTAVTAGTFTIDSGNGNGAVSIGGLDAAASAQVRAGDLVTAINNVSSQTGVGATYNTSTGAIVLNSEAAVVTIAGAGATATTTGIAAGTNNTVSTTTGISSLTVANAPGASLAISQVDSALKAVNTARASLGAAQSRFESVVANQQVTAENLSASRSRIVDADFAAETAQLTKAQILQQSGIAMLAQANSIPQNVLALLQ
jgi:flagellin